MLAVQYIFSDYLIDPESEILTNGTFNFNTREKDKN